MATTYSDTVNAYYLAYYGRPADPAGLAYWTAVLEQSKGDASSIVGAFATSAEATARFGGASASDRISEVYQQLFGRAPDKAGLDYWTKAIESGQLSVANAAIDIMNGAQKADEQTSTLRLQVAADFTAEVKASGVAYDGAAAIEAARVLISAVNADSKPADIANLVKAGASLVQTAHDNPDIIKALANDGDLSAVLNTAGGKADPVGVVQAMASIGKAALTDGAGLSSLLQGGGMSGLLNSLPAGTSVKDVAAAVSSGGLSAGTDVANPPPVDVPVAITPIIAFAGADGHDLPAGTTLIANSVWYFIDVHGMPSGAKAIFEYATAASPNVWQAAPDDIDLPDGTYFVRYTVKDAAGNSGTSNALKLIMDHSVPFLNMALAEDTGVNSVDHLSSNGAVKISGLHANETWFYSFDNKTWTSGTTDANGEATIPDSGAVGKQSLVVRTIENVNGNSQFTSTELDYTIDKTAPPAPTGVKLQADSGTAGDGITNNGNFVVSGLQKGVMWQFSSDGKTWYAGTPADADGNATGYAQSTGDQTLQVRTYDLAGNTSEAVSLHFTLDARNPAEGLKLDHIGATGATGEWHTTLQTADVVFSYTGTIQDGDVLEYTNFYAPGDAVQTRIDTSMIDPVAKTITFHDFDLSGADAYLSIHATSVAGASITYQQPIDGPYTSTFTSYSAAGLNIMLSAQATAHLYLTDGANPSVQVKTLDANGDLNNSQQGTMVGEQSTAIQGVLGAGNDTGHLSAPQQNGSKIYAFGSSTGDALSGTHVWGFGGDDTITATGTTAYHNNVVSGGAGADTIHTETASTSLLYQGSQDSSLVDGVAAAHGFDTVYLSTGAASSFTDTLVFEGLALGSYYKLSGNALTGTETGNALLAAMNLAVGSSFKTGESASQLALIDFGTDGSGNQVNFLTVDVDKDGVITSADYVVKIVGTIDTSGVYTSSGGNGAIDLYTHVIL